METLFAGKAYLTQLTLLFLTAIIASIVIPFSAMAYDEKLSNCQLKKMEDINSDGGDKFKMAMALATESCIQQLSKPLSRSEILKIKVDPASLHYHIPGETILGIKFYNGSEKIIRGLVLEVETTYQGRSESRIHKIETLATPHSYGLDEYFQIGPQLEGAKYKYALIGAEGY